jgi:DNA-binding transcriptional LysR family regulator
MMNGKWQWDDVRFFLAVSREGSLSGAARALGVDHVTVGRRIALLEKQLSAKLLNRTPDGLMTTSAGQVILRECEAMEGAALSLERLVSGQDTRAAGSVRVTANDWLTYSIIVPSIASFRERYPELQIDLLASIRVLDIARREADLAVRVTFARPTDPSLVCRRLGNIGYALYASRQYLANHGTPERGEGLGGHDLIGYMGAPVWFGPLYMGESIEGARTSMRANNPFVRLKATADGLGISELACFFGDGYPDVIRVWPNETPTLRPVWLISHEDLRRATRIRVVSAAIADAFQRQAKVLRNGQRNHARN